jgi:hypothetical protein
MMSKRVRERTKVASIGGGSDSNHVLDIFSPEPKKRYVFGCHLLKIQVSNLCPIKNLSLSLSKKLKFLMGHRCDSIIFDFLLEQACTHAF